MPAPPAVTSSGRLRPLFEAAGARWIEVPVLHPADPFLETAGEDIRRRMFVTEGRSGEQLALRPDFTIPVCLGHIADGGGPARYAYEGLVFRRHDSGSPERPETGYEDIGRGDLAVADAQALALAVSGAAALQHDAPQPDAGAAGGLQIRLGDIGLFVAVLRAFDLPEPWRRRLRRVFGLPAIMEAQLDRLAAPRATEEPRVDAAIRAAAAEHDPHRLAALVASRLAADGHTEGTGRTPLAIAGRFLDQRVLAEERIAPDALAALRRFLALGCDLREGTAALARFAAEQQIDLGAALALFAARSEAIARLAPDARIRFEAGFGRPLDYYTGLVFDIRAPGASAPLAGGGRYDRLMELLGAAGPVPAVGFAIRLDGEGA